MRRVLSVIKAFYKFDFPFQFVFNLSILIFLQDTRTLIVKELYNVEKSYVESLQFLMAVRARLHLT